MNMVKKIAIVAAFLCAATVANAQEEMTFGARLGYNLQSLGEGTLAAAQHQKYSMGMLGIGIGGVANIPVGPVVVAPELAFSYRTNVNSESISILGLGSKKYYQNEFAISLPIMVKYFLPVEGLYVTAGIQIDVPIAAEWCDDKGEKCKDLDGKTKTITEIDPTTGLPEIDQSTNLPITHDEKNPKRASFDLGLPIGVGYMVMPNLSVDFRLVLGLSKLVKYEEEIDLFFMKTKVEVETGSLTTFGLGATYYF